MNVTIKCKNCQSLLSVKEKPERYIYACPTCDVSFRMKIRFGNIGAYLIFYTVPLMLAYLLSGGDINQVEVYNIIISIILVSLYFYRPYSMQVLKEKMIKI